MTPLKGPEPAGTDVWMACNAYTYQAKTGVLNRLTLKKFFPIPPLEVFGETAPVAQMLGATAAGVIWNNRDDVIRDVLGSLKNDGAQTKGGPLAKAKGVAQNIKGGLTGKIRKDVAEKIKDVSYFDLRTEPGSARAGAGRAAIVGPRASRCATTPGRRATSAA